MTIIDRLKDKRCRNCKYYNVRYMWCTFDKRYEGRYDIATIKSPKLICFDKKEVEK